MNLDKNRLTGTKNKFPEAIFHSPYPIQKKICENIWYSLFYGIGGREMTGGGSPWLNLDYSGFPSQQLTESCTDLMLPPL